MATNAVAPTPVPSTSMGVLDGALNSVDISSQLNTATETPAAEPVPEVIPEVATEPEATAETPAETPEPETKPEGEEATEEPSEEKSEEDRIKEDDLKRDEKTKRTYVTRAKFDRVQGYEKMAEKLGLTGPEDVEKLHQDALLANDIQACFLSDNVEEQVNLYKFLNAGIDNKGEAMTRFAERLPHFLAHPEIGNPSALTAIAKPIAQMILADIGRYAEQQSGQVGEGESAYDKKEVFKVTQHWVREYMKDIGLIAGEKEKPEKPSREAQELAQLKQTLSQQQQQEANNYIEGNTASATQQVFDKALESLKKVFGDDTAAYETERRVFSLMVDDHIAKNPPELSAARAEIELAQKKFKANPTKEAADAIWRARVMLKAKAATAIKPSFMKRHTRQVAETSAAKKVQLQQSAIKTGVSGGSTAPIRASQPVPAQSPKTVAGTIEAALKAKGLI